MTLGLTTPIGDVPAVVLLALVMGVAAVVVAIAAPHYRRWRLQQRIRDLPPPPVKNEEEPDLRLPRRGGGGEPPAG